MKSWLVAILIVLMGVFTSKGQNVTGFDTMLGMVLDGAVPTISSDSLKTDMASGEWVILDARELDEYTVSHISGAHYVGYDQFDLNSLDKIDRSKNVVVYCSIGKRSEDIGKKLLDAGFENVFNLYGGIFDWTNRGYPVVDYTGTKVKQVHPYNAVWGIWVNNYKKKYEP